MQIEKIKKQLVNLYQKRKWLQKEFALHQGEFCSLLGFLERMGLQLPPPLLVTPEDALRALRSAFLLGAFVPQMRKTIEDVMQKLSSLTTVINIIDLKRKE